MDNSWLTNIDDKILNYLYSLKKNNTDFDYFPSKNNLTQNGKKLRLGFSCYAIKILVTLGEWKNLNPTMKNDWNKYLNSFQTNMPGTPTNSYVDPEIYNFYNNPSSSFLLKDNFKKFLNFTLNKNYKLKKVAYQEAVRAESKQAIATLLESGSKNKLIYNDFPKEKDKIENFLSLLNWSKPWSAGGQASALALFLKTQVDIVNYSDSKSTISNFFADLAKSETGLYYKGSTPNSSEAINGAMKIITALDWLGEEIHYPDRLIDYCLSKVPSGQGCDLVDVIYVLYKCSIQTNYKRKEINNYMKETLNLISLHYKEEEGGFSYSIDKSQEYYYGLKITNGENYSDIHGTLLLTWALAMIFKTTEYSKYDWEIIKP